DTIPAIHTDSQVDVEPDGVLLDVGVRMLAGHDRDAFGRANCLAEHAPDAARRVIVALSQPVAAAEPRHERSALLGKLDSRRGGNILEPAQKMGSVDKQVSKEMLKCDLQAAEDLGYVQLFPESQFAPADNFYRHLGCLSKKD